MQAKEFIRRHSLAVGVLLMFALTWPIDLSNSGVFPFRVPFALALLVGYGFVAASLIMTALTLGKGGVIALLKRFLIWRVGGKWYMVDTVPKAVVLTWLYNNTGGSLLLTTLCHASWNTAGMFLPMANTVSGENMGASVIALSLLVVAVIVITIWAGPARLSRTDPIQVQEGAPLPHLGLATLRHTK